MVVKLEICLPFLGIPWGKENEVNMRVFEVDRPLAWVGALFLVLTPVGWASALAPPGLWLQPPPFAFLMEGWVWAVT